MITPLANSAIRVVSNGELIAFTVRESMEGNTDLNGDGDTLDDVLFLYHPFLGGSFNMRAAVSAFEVHGPVVAYAVSEFDDSRDLNVDGDQDDHILHSLDYRGFRINHRLALFPQGGGDIGGDYKLDMKDGLLAVLVGDQSMNPPTIRLIDLVSGSRLDTEFQSQFSGFGPLGSFVALQPERAAGADLNGDGDQLDHVIQVLDLITGQTTNLGLALSTFRGISHFSIGDRLLVMSIDEAADGDSDYDGDGLAESLVAHTYNFFGGQISNTRVSTPVLPTGRTAGRYALLNDKQGELVVWDAIASTAWRTGQVDSAASINTFSGALINVDESRDGFDLNGDGDSLDSVLHFIEYRNQITRNLGVVSFPVFDMGASVITSSTEDSSTGDLNGDGDTEDTVNFLWIKSLSELSLSPIEGHPIASLDFTIGLIGTREDQSDLNGDGDTLDTIATLAQVFSPASSFDLGLALSATNPMGANYRQLMPILISEASQGASDLNGDGDSNDDVLFLVR